MPDEKSRDAAVTDYDTFVNWDARLTRELPFYRALFDAVDAHTVVDVGSGSARLAIEFAATGLSVDAVDPDDSMLRAAEANVAVASDRITKGGGELRLLKGGFGEIGALGLRRADALTCTGNALPHVVGVDGLRDALADFAAVLRPGGVLVLHLLNHTRLIEKKPRSIMPVVREVPEGTRVFLRVIDYPVGDGEFFGFDFVTLVRTMAGEWTCASHKAAHTQLPVAVLRFELESAGFERIESFGGHDRRRLDEDSDESVILVARLAP